VTPESHLGPCERFTLLESNQGEHVAQCEVCDHPESAHESAGRRTLSGGQIEELRRRILIERFDQQQAERQRSVPPSPSISANGDPEFH